MAKHIAAELSKTNLHFRPNTRPEQFTLTVYNNSYKDKEKSRFASFQLSLVAAGQKEQASQDWYRLVPAVSYKIPPGDNIQFQVEILKVPPVSKDFVGTLNLTAKVYSPELKDDVYKDIRLIVQGEGLHPPQLSIADADLRVAADEQTEITVALYNPNRKSIDCGVVLNGLEPQWLPEGAQKTLRLQAGEKKALSFACQIPPPPAAPSQRYPITLDIVRPVIVKAAAEASLTVFPTGSASFGCDPLEQWIPEAPGRWLNPRQGEATVDLSFDNQSNLSLEGSVAVLSEASSSTRLIGRLRSQPDQAEATSVADASPQVTVSPGEVASVELRMHQRLPWLGWTRRRQLQLAASVSDPQIPLNNASPTVVLHTAPVIPFWLQLLGAGIGAMTLAIAAHLFTHRGHSEPVNAVQINGQSNEVISASDDQTLRRWRIKNNRLIPAGIIFKANKSIRTTLYRPVNNDEIVAVFENGSLEIINDFSDQTSTLNEGSADRVFDAVFSRDARTLYSAHGSGQVYQWPAALSDRPSISRQASSLLAGSSDRFSLRTLALAGDNNSLLVIAGRYNKVAIADLETGSTVPLPYSPQGRQTDFILDMAAAEAQPNRLATADNQGAIMLWDLAQCRENLSDCAPIDQWPGHGGNAVRAVAFSQDGCYLASAGDDGQVRLWPLTVAGTRQPYALEGRLLHRSREIINAVDISQQFQRLQIVSGGDDHRVKLSSVKIPKNRQPLGSCPLTPE